MKVNSFTFFEEYYELIKYLKEEDRLLLYDAIFKYMFEDEETEFNGLNKGIWINLKRPLSVSKIKGKNGKIKTKSNENQKEIKTKSKQNRKSSLATMSMSLSMSKSNNNKNIFIKPTIEEIKEYCDERKNNINANSFYDFYESKGWKVGNQSMKDWKACVRTWEQRQTSKKEELPGWFDKDLKNKEMTEGEKKELDALLDSIGKEIENI